MKKKSQLTQMSIIYLIITIIIITIAAIFIYQKIWGNRHAFEFTELPTQSDYFTPSFVGTYSNNNFGNLPSGCTKNTNGVLNCRNGTKIEFYVGISNNGSKERTFYSDPCIITGYKKGAICKEDNFLINNNNKGCRITSANTENCRTGVNFTLSIKGDYRIYPGAKCSADECPDTNNPNNLPTVNTNSFIDITVT